MYPTIPERAIEVDQIKARVESQNRVGKGVLTGLENAFPGNAFPLRAKTDTVEG